MLVQLYKLHRNEVDGDTIITEDRSAVFRDS